MLHLLILTDIHERPAPRLCLSTRLVRQLPQIETCSTFALAELSGRPDLSGEALHTHLFEHAGMDTAVTAVTRHANVAARHQMVLGLGYSAGGTALWRAARAGLDLKALVCLSSTRLRDEVALDLPTFTVFGAQDAQRPTDDWLANTPSDSLVIADAAHDFYAQHTGVARQTAAQFVTRNLRKTLA